MDGMSATESAKHQEALRVTTIARAHLAEGFSLDDAATLLNLSTARLSRLLRAREKADAGNPRALLPGKSTGRPAVCDWPAEDVQAIRELALRTNRGDELISLSHAVRRCVFEGKLSEETTAALKRPASTKHYIPTSLRKQIEIPRQVVRYHRSPRNARLSGVYVPGSTRLTSDGSRRLIGGERFSYDDGSQNQVVVVPWPYGGSKEADKYGHRTCRGQWLLCHDDSTSVIPAWTFTMRPRDSYRDQDAMSIVYRSAADVCRPDQVVIEGGAWQSKRAKAFYRASGIEQIDAKGRPHLKLVENWFNRAWTYLSAFADGQIGRFRGEYERENKLLTQARAGTIDALEYFPMLPDLLREFDACVRFLNQDPVESREYGTWVPIERWERDLAEHPRDCLDGSLAPYAAPESHDVTVRKGGMVITHTTCPLGIRMPYTFAHEDLARYETRKVRVLYDPFENPVRAAIFDHRTNKPICLATCMNPPPAPVADADWQIVRDFGSTREALAVKKAMANAVRSEYRALGSGGRKSISERRGPDGVARVERDAGRDARAPSEEFTRGGEGYPDAPSHRDGSTQPASLPSRRAAFADEWRDRAKDLDAREAALLNEY